MREMHLKDVGASLSAVVAEVQHGDQIVITEHGEAAVLVSWDEWKRVSDRPSFAGLLTSSPFEEGDLSQRDGTTPRDAGL